jgi:DNA topoisomerase-6 subunit B
MADGATPAPTQQQAPATAQQQAPTQQQAPAQQATQQKAEQMATQQRAISISEFFQKNRHLLGYDNKIKALLIIIKEAVDNGLDATEEARIVPEIHIKIEELEKEKYKLVIRDNGPGIVRAQVPRIFGSLLYGSKFHKLKQSRGQQGLGISCAVLYSQLTTGEPTEVVTSTGDGVTHRYKLKIDVKKNEPVILEDTEEPSKENWHGVQATFISEGIYREHKQSILEYLKQTAISNPYATIKYDAPSGKYEFHKGVEKLPPMPKEIKPHLLGVEVGILQRMLGETSARSISSFLTTEFTRVGKTTAEQIIHKAGIMTEKMTPHGKREVPDVRKSPRKIKDDEIVRIVKAVEEVKLTKPPTDCLSPLGNAMVESGLKKELAPEFVTAITRPPAVYRGWPFQVEIGIAYGGGIKEPRFMRFANRVPLLYQAGDCAITKSIMGIDWRRYGIETEKLPTGPIAIFIHIVSVWVPFTSESKEAVASYPVIIKEIKLAIQEAARKLSMYLSGMRRAEYQAERMRIFERYAVETAAGLSELTGENKEEIKKMIDNIVSKIKPEEIEQTNNNNNNTAPTPDMLGNKPADAGKPKESGGKLEEMEDKLEETTEKSEVKAKPKKPETEEENGGETA